MPIGALPVDLQLEVKRTTFPARRLESGALRPPRPWMVAVGGIALGVAALHLLTVDDVGAFGSLLRFVALFGGAGLLAAYLSGARALGFRAPNGHQIVLGPASMVIADTKAVRVVPAEELSVDRERVFCGTEVVYDFTFDLDASTSEWSARLRELAAKAKSDESAREGDRFRQAARRAPPMSRGAVWWSRRGTQVVAFGFALGLAGFAEAGPIEWRGTMNHTVHTRARELLLTTDAAGVQRNRAIRAAAAAVREASEKKKRERLLAAALDGDDLDARFFLRQYPSPDDARPRVQARLRELCAKKVPEKRYEQAWPRFLRLVMRGVCETPEQKVYFTMTGTQDARVARPFLSSLTSDAAALLGGTTPEVTTADPKPPIGPCSPATCPYLRLEMTLVSVTEGTGYYDQDEQWTIDAEPIGADGSPIPNAKFHHQIKITRSRY